MYVCTYILCTVQAVLNCYVSGLMKLNSARPIGSKDIMYVTAIRVGYVLQHKHSRSKKP